jgi:hypothetical protein
MNAPAQIVAPLRDHQLELERLYNKNQTVSRIRSEFENCTAFDFIGYMTTKGIPEEFGIDMLTQMVLHKRTTLPTLVGILRVHFSTCQEAADMLLQAALCDLVDWSPVTKQFIVKFDISPQVQAEIDCFQYPLPMVIKPRIISDNHDTGYLLSRNSIILRKNHHDDDVCLDHINRVNNIKFTLNFDTAHMVANKWRNLDKPKHGESKENFARRVRAFNKYDRTAKNVIDLLIQHGNEFYLTHKYDKRGRVYCQGYHVNYQGNPWSKAIIELADKELVE